MRNEGKEVSCFNLYFKDRNILYRYLFSNTLVCVGEDLAYRKNKMK